MELTFSNDYDSAKLLDDIMNSYPGRDRGSIMADEQSMTFMLLLLAHQHISVTECAYPYDISIRDDSAMMEIYSELARETRWKRFAHTEIEGIRINALRQMRQHGKPFYDGDYICYKGGQICAHCGNLSLPELLLYFANHENIKQFFIFTYPYWAEDHTAKYYRFGLSESAVKGAQAYRSHVWETLCRASEVNNVFPEIPDLNLSDQ